MSTRRLLTLGLVTFLGLALLVEDDEPDPNALLPVNGGAWVVTYTQHGAWPTQGGAPAQGWGQFDGRSPQLHPGNGGGLGYGQLGYSGYGSGSMPGVTYDPAEYSNPESSYYDPYEVDSEGWSGGAHDNPSSSYYSGSFDSLGY